MGCNIAKVLAANDGTRREALGFGLDESGMARTVLPLPARPAAQLRPIDLGRTKNARSVIQLPL
jgi:hypothetical protein